MLRIIVPLLLISSVHATDRCIDAEKTEKAIGFLVTANAVLHADSKGEPHIDYWVCTYQVDQAKISMPQPTLCKRRKTFE